MVNLYMDSTLLELNKGQNNLTIQKLAKVNIHTLGDILWVIPLHWDIIPEMADFTHTSVGQYFKGEGRVVNIHSYLSKQKGKGKTRLHHILAHVQDLHGPTSLTLRWPNAYLSQKYKIEQLKDIQFFGKIQIYRNQHEIISPTIIQNKMNESVKIQYPTLNGAKSSQIKKLLDKIPQSFWESIEDPIDRPHRFNIDVCHLRDAFKIIHGKVPSSEGPLLPKHYQMAKRRLIYQEFYLEQVKIAIRRNSYKQNKSPILKISDQMLQKIVAHFPYKLTNDQTRTVQDIIHDFKSSSSMMRMIQGEVGCGKTTVAFISALLSNLNHYQAALMCPTETLAAQHYQNAHPLFKKFALNCALLLGPQSLKKKRKILQDISLGKINFVIGTHTLFQDHVQFHNLGLSIIDEQQKFGVNQRLRLSDKRDGGHTLMMTATPIPRSLSLTHYGDLDISTIRDMPAQRKGIQTRIIRPSSFEVFLSFMKTRIEMGEQGHIVAPAIEDNPDNDFIAIEKVLKRFKRFFPEFSLKLLHGKLNAEEKETIFQDFYDGKINILISTSIVEVGIDVANATVMAIMNPERFGLSSLHQLRGRVGRGKFPGFCFLITESTHPEHLQRLKVIEQTTNGFEIAEADLIQRGEGDLFGLQQSGKISRKLGDITRDQALLLQVKKDFPLLQNSKLYLQDYKKLSKELPAIRSV